MIIRLVAPIASVLRMKLLVAIRLRALLRLASSASIVILTATGIWISGAAETPHADPITFENIAARSGVDFVLRNSATPARRQIETMVSGVAIFDYNSDGKPDIYFVNGARQPQLDKPDPSYYNRLYRNNGDGRSRTSRWLPASAETVLPLALPPGTLTMMDGKTCSSQA